MATEQRKNAILKRVNHALLECGTDPIELKDIADDETIDGMPWREWLQALLMDE